ncbi:MAG: alpha/beta hydrolase-fold protein [Sphingomonas bacterium]
MLLALALLVSPFTADAQAMKETPYAIERTLASSITAPDGHAYRIFASWPDGVPPATGWPVLYLLDGADHFATATETARRLARAGRRSGIVPGVIIGIDSGPLARRVLDYTPAAPGWAIPKGAPASGLPTGGGEAFLTFLDRQLRPWVAARWSVDPRRQTLAGHSFGGLIALHAMLTRPGLFARYAAISPSLWYGDGLIAREAKGAHVQGAHALIAIGTEERGPSAQPDSAAEALVKILSEHGADVRFLPLEGQGHGTTMLVATADILALAFGEERP